MWNLASTNPLRKIARAFYISENRMTNIEPIRKPNYKQKHQISRHRQIARTAHARLLNLNGTVYLYSGNPHQFDKIHNDLTELGQSQSPDFDLVQSLADNLNCDGQLSIHTITTVSRSLCKWRHWLHHKSNQRNRALDAERNEIELLTERLRFLSQSLTCQAVHDGSPFLLTQDEEYDFNSLVQPSVASCTIRKTGSPIDISVKRDLTAYQQNLLRIVFWFRGQSAAINVLMAIKQSAFQTPEWTAKLRSVEKWLNDLTKKLKYTPDSTVKAELHAYQPLQFVIYFGTQLSNWKKWNKRDPVDEKIAVALENIKSIRRIAQKRQAIEFPTTIAAWAISGSANYEFPTGWIDGFNNNVHINQLTRRAWFLVKNETRRGFATLLQMIDPIDRAHTLDFLAKAMTWLEQGVSKPDVRFAIDHLQHLDLEPQLSIKWIRRVVELYCKLFAAKTNQAISQCEPWLLTSFGLESHELFMRWLGRFPKRLLNEKQKSKIDSILDCFDDAAQLKSKEDNPYADAISRWARAWKATSAFPDERDLPKELRRWLRTLGEFHRICGEPARLPKSVAKEIGYPEKRAREIQYLRERIKKGLGNDQMQARLDYLLEQENLRAVSRKSLRVTQEACLTTGLNALRTVIGTTASEIWKSKTGWPIPAVSYARQIAMSHWVGKMTANQLQLLTETLDRHGEHGGDYKQYLSFNRNWISKARCKGVCVSTWLNPPSCLQAIEGKNYRIEVSTEPMTIYSMGDLFGTCLSIGNCNEMSVLANAAHANKQVLFVYDDEDRPIARQLIALNKSFRLIGYHCYVAVDGSRSQLRAAIIAAVARYCGMLAIKMGVELSDNGELERLGGHFWYDDGTHQWDSAAKVEQWRSASAIHTADVFLASPIDHTPIICHPDLTGSVSRPTLDYVTA